MGLVVPAVLPDSKRDLEQKLALLSQIPLASRMQIDVVDGRLAAPASWPYTDPEEFRAMAKRSEMLPALDRLEYEIDLMCLDALSAADAWLALGASRLTFHAESTPDLAQLLASARKHYGSLISFGVALTIESDMACIASCLDEIAYVQFMGIARIGRQGEPFDERAYAKMEAFRAAYPSVPFQVDGGVSLHNAKKLLALGASNLVVGSAILRAHDPAAEFAKFEALRSPLGVQARRAGIAPRARLEE